MNFYETVGRRRFIDGTVPALIRSVDGLTKALTAMQTPTTDTLPVKPEDRPEFLGQILDVFEDFLEEKGIEIPNPEKDEDEDLENAAILYGTDYGNLSDQIESIMINWGVLKDESPSAGAKTISLKAYEQVLWERDLALKQLAEIGKGLGQKMDDIVVVDHTKMDE